MARACSTLLLATTLGLLACTASATSARRRYDINTPDDFATYWAGKLTTTSINPCLYASVLNSGPDYATPPPAIYQPGYELLWAADTPNLVQYLQWNKQYADEPNGNKLITAITNAVGFNPNYYYDPALSPPMDIQDPAHPTGTWSFYVFNACKKHLRRSSPTPGYWIKHMRTKYGVKLPAETVNTLTSSWFDLKSYTNCKDVWCVASLNFTDTTDCNCNSAFVSTWTDLNANYAPYNKESYKPKGGSDTTAACIGELKARGDLSAAAVRAAVAICYGAYPFNTGNGRTWDGNPEFKFGNAEWVMKNLPISKLRAKRCSMGDYV